MIAFNAGLYFRFVLNVLSVPLWQKLAATRIAAANSTVPENTRSRDDRSKRPKEQKIDKPVKVWIVLGVEFLAFALLLFFSAGTIMWSAGWAFLRRNPKNWLEFAQ
jgi:hypothetical protein